MVLQYITDENGHQTAVVVPIDYWTRLTSEVSQLQEELIFSQDVRAAFQEIQDFNAGKTELHPAEDLFNE